MEIVSVGYAGGAPQGFWLEGGTVGREDSRYKDFPGRAAPGLGRFARR